MSWPCGFESQTRFWLGSSPGTWAQVTVWGKWFQNDTFHCTFLQWGRPGFDPWVRKVPWRRAWQPTPVFLPGDFRGQRNLVGYSPCSLNRLDMTEWLTLSLQPSLSPESVHTAPQHLQFVSIYSIFLQLNNSACDLIPTIKTETLFLIYDTIDSFFSSITNIVAFSFSPLFPLLIEEHQL